MTDELMYIPNDDTQIAPSLDYNKLLKCLKIQLNEPTNHNLKKIIFPKLIIQEITKHYRKTLGNIAINCPMSPPSLEL